MYHNTSFNNNDDEDDTGDDGDNNQQILPPNFFAMQRQLRRIRNGVLPASPSTPLEVQQKFQLPGIMNEYGKTKATASDEPTPFYRCVVIEQQFAYCIFASQRIIKEISKLPEGCRNYYMDGTFKVVPSGQFNQLLIIYAEFFQKVY